MRFQIPQFIEIEDKIFGPLTFKQFVYLAGGGAMCLLLFVFLPNFLAIVLSLPIAGFAAALAFLKINDKPFIHLIEAFFHYSTKSKLYIWKKQATIDNRQQTTDVKKSEIQQVYVPKLSESKLRELTWSLDIKENQNPVTNSTNNLPPTTNS